MKTRFCFPALAAVLTLLALPATAGTVFMDDFNDGVLDPNHTPIGSGVLHEVAGRLFLATKAPGDGVFLAVNDTGIICFEITGVVVSDMRIGDYVRWEWVVQDAAGDVYTLLESTWTKVGSVEYTTTKKGKDGKTIQVVNKFNEDDLKKFEPFKVTWDRRTKKDGTEEVQMELRDPKTWKITKLFPWQDPPGFTTVGFAVTTSAEFLSIGAFGGADVHNDAIEAGYEPFGPDVFIEVPPGELPNAPNPSEPDPRGREIGASQP